jgi:hypothetical protein
LDEQMNHDLRQAMKGGEKLRVSTLRLLKAALKNREIAKGATLEEDEVIEVIIAATKHRRETIKFAREHGRADIAEQEEHELAILETYLPIQLNLDEVRQHIDAVVQELRATSPQDVGRVMKILMPTLKGRVDGSLVNRLVRERLAEGKRDNGV